MTYEILEAGWRDGRKGKERDFSIHMRISCFNTIFYLDNVSSSLFSGSLAAAKRNGPNVDDL
jgi:hypothetical protein